MPDVKEEHVGAVRGETGVGGRVGPWHCRDNSIAGQEVFFLGRSSDRPAARTQVRVLVKLVGGPLPDPLGHPAAPAMPARRSTGHNRLLVNKRVQTCGRVGA
jgi:hypothetical protein